MLERRPNTDAVGPVPSAGPLLLRGGRTLTPAGRLSSEPTAIALHAAWGTLRYRPVAGGVELLAPCPRGARLRLIEWIAGNARLGPRSIGAAGRRVTFSARARVARLAGVRSSSAHEKLRGVRIEIPCAGTPVRITWHAD